MGSSTPYPETPTSSWTGLGPGFRRDERFGLPLQQRFQMREPATAEAEGFAGGAGLDGQGGVPQGELELGVAGVGEHEAQNHLFGVRDHQVERLARLAAADAGDDVAVDDDLAALDLLEGIDEARAAAGSRIWKRC